MFVDNKTSFVTSFDNVPVIDYTIMKGYGLFVVLGLESAHIYLQILNKMDILICLPFDFIML